MTSPAVYMADVAARLLGEPSKKSPVELRFGKHGSLCVNLKKNTWFDHENNTGGGVLDLIVRQIGGDHRSAADWMRGNGFDLDDQPGPRPNGSQPPKAKVVASYVYRDPDSNPRFRVNRLEPKTFTQQRYDPKTKSFVGGRGCMDGVQLLPYRLDEWLPEATLPIIVVEGEKDADRLFDLGYLATTNPGGAEKWPDHFAQWFVGRDLLLIPDNDPAGRKHVAAVAQKVCTTVARTRVLELPNLPPKGDVSDWLDAGHTADELDRAVTNAPILDNHILTRLAEGKPAPQPFIFIDHADLGEPIPPREFLVQDFIPLGCISSLYGEGGTGKSFLAIMIAMCVAAGRPWLGLNCTQATVMALMCEDDKDEIRRRRNKIAKALGIRRQDIEGRLLLSPRVGLPNTMMDFPAGVPHRTELFDQIIAEALHTNARLIILDNAAQLYAGNENDRAQVTAFLNAVAGIAIAINGAVLLLGHPPKAEGVVYSGSTAWDAVVRSRSWFERVKPAQGADPDAETRYTLKRLKANYAPPEQTIELVLDPVSEVVVLAKDYIEPTAHREARDRKLGAARTHVLNVVSSLNSRGDFTSHAKQAQNFLPRVLANFDMTNDLPQDTLAKAMQSLITDGLLTPNAKVGAYPNRLARYGLAKTSELKE